MMEFLLWFVTCFFSTLGFTFFYIKITDATHIFRFKVVFIFLIGVILETLIKFYDVTFLSIISYFIFYPFLFYIIKPVSLKKLFCYLFYIWLLSAILDLFLIIIIMIFNNFVVSFDIYNYWFKIIPAFILFLFLLILSCSVNFKKIFNNIVLVSSNIKHSDFLFIVFSVFTLIVGVSILSNINSLKISFLLYLCIALVIFVFILLLQKKHIEYENHTFINFLRINNRFYLNANDENRIFKHNLMAKLLSIESVSNKRSRMLIEELIMEFNDKLTYRSLIASIPYGFNGIINQKLEPFCNKINIKIRNDLDKDVFELLTPRKYNVLVEKMSILIDNAIESCLNSCDKILIVNLYLDKNNICLEIKNSFSGNIDVENLGVINYSTKGRKRGLGLYSILRNNEVQTDVKIVNEFFVSKLVVKIKNN